MGHFQKVQNIEVQQQSLYKQLKHVGKTSQKEKII